MYFTGSKEHNIELRQRALKQNLTLNEYHLEPVEGADREDPTSSITDEAGIYKELGLIYVEPALREGRGELDAADEGDLPKLVAQENLRGTFHNHTTRSDGRSTLEEMAAKRPLNDKEMHSISGVGERKLHLYGSIFIQAILEFMGKKNNTLKGNTQKLTLELFNQGHSIAEIAAKRELSPTTIEGHLATLIQNGESIDISSIISQAEIDQIAGALKYLEEPFQLKAIFE